jgi:sugar/nucleoside kinase (ribokinase family)
MTLISVGNVVVDILARVPALPERGADVLATASGMSPGGSFNTLFAATRQGLPTSYAGGHGTGFFGDLIRAHLRECGIDALLAPIVDRDSGYDIVLVDDGGERTFVTSFGAEADVPAAALASVHVEPTDFVHVSGYGLLDATNGAVIAPWLRQLDARASVLLDPGPLVADIPPTNWTVAIERANWLSCNEREATILTGEPDARTAIDILNRSARNVLVRLGADGCLMATDGRVDHIPGFAVSAIDTNGAGDAHNGAFLAALAAGLSSHAAATRANACAAIATTRRGPATAPTLAEVVAFLATRQPR